MSAEYLRKYGATVLENGWSICFIRPGEKRPFGEDWESKDHDIKRVKAAIQRGKGDFGVGIKARKTPAVDIDCYDEAIVKHMRQFTIDLLGDTLERVGQPPKLAMIYRAVMPFRKVQSDRYIDDEGRSVKCEILADGQQFVAFHIHPDTKKPYRWKDKKAPHNTKAKDLPIIGEEDAQAIADEFDRIVAEKTTWQRAKSVKRIAAAKSSGRELDLADPFISDAQKTEHSPDQIRLKLQSVPSAEDYEVWFHVGMALYHQFDGSDDGLMLWHEWSSQATNYDMDALDEKWATFDIEGKKRAPITARFILKLAAEEEERIAVEELDDIRSALRETRTLQQVKSVADRVKHTAFEHMTREILSKDFQDQIKRITNHSPTISSVRQMIRYENPDNRATPVWMEGYVFCQQDETFYSMNTKMTLTKPSFDASYSRYTMTRQDRLEGRSVPEHSASSIALNLAQIPVVYNKMYLPGEGEMFSVDGLDYVNMYVEDRVPVAADKLSHEGRKCAAIIEKHLEHLFPVARERKLLLSWMAYIVQTNKRVNWSPIIQGVQGDGKTFFYELMGAVLGADNVMSLPGDALAEGFTGWSEGSQFVFVEEIRLHGQNRFDVVNKIKTFITNAVVSVRRMRVDRYDVINTVSYLMATNHKDGMPVDSSDSRYFPMFSNWQTKTAIDQFNKENPKYYDRLYGTIAHPRQLRRWLLDYELSEEFNPKKRAPPSLAKIEMVFLNQSDEEDGFMEVLADTKDPLCCKELLCTARLADIMTDEGHIPPYGRGLKKMLSEHGFTYIGRLWVDGTNRRLWSQTPQIWRKCDTTTKMQKMIQRHIKGYGVDVSDL